MIARPMTLVEMRAPAQMEQVQLVHQPVAFQKVQRAVNGNARDAWMYSPRATQQSTGVQMPPRGFHHLQKHAPLMRETHASRRKLLLQTPRLALDVDALTCGYAMLRQRRVFFLYPVMTAGHTVSAA